MGGSIRENWDISQVIFMSRNMACTFVMSDSASVCALFDTYGYAL